jgi:hypothetical protein
MFAELSSYINCIEMQAGSPVKEERNLSLSSALIRFVSADLDPLSNY